MIKNSLLSKFISFSIVLGGAILVGNESAFAFNINVGSQSSSRTTRPGSNNIVDEITTTYTGVPIPNFPGKTMTCTIIEDQSLVSPFEASCSNETLSAEDLPDGVTIDQVISQFTPFNNESESSVTGEKFEPEQFISGAIESPEIFITYDFTVTIDSPSSGSLVGEEFLGFFTLNSSQLRQDDGVDIIPIDFSFKFKGKTYTENNVMLNSVLFSGDSLEGLELEKSSNISFTFSGSNFSFFIPTDNDLEEGEGTVEYTLRQDSAPGAVPASVPEPSAIFGLLIFSAMGYGSKLKEKKK